METISLNKTKFVKLINHWRLNRRVNVWLLPLQSPSRRRKNLPVYEHKKATCKEIIRKTVDWRFLLFLLMLVQGRDLDWNMINWQVDRREVRKTRQTKSCVQTDRKMNELFFGKKKTLPTANSTSLSMHRISLNSIFFFLPINWHSRSHLLYWYNHLKYDFFFFLL